MPESKSLGTVAAVDALPHDQPTVTKNSRTTKNNKHRHTILTYYINCTNHVKDGVNPAIQENPQKGVI